MTTNDYLQKAGERPWRVYDMHKISDAKGVIVTRISNSQITPSANAHLIVTAVNNHERLVEELVDMIVLARLGIIACVKSGCNDEQASNMWNQYEDARALLQSIEQEKKK